MCFFGSMFFFFWCCSEQFFGSEEWTFGGKSWTAQVEVGRISNSHEFPEIYHLGIDPFSISHRRAFKEKTKISGFLEKPKNFQVIIAFVRKVYLSMIKKLLNCNQCFVAAVGFAGFTRVCGNFPQVKEKFLRVRKNFFLFFIPIFPILQLPREPNQNKQLRKVKVSTNSLLRLRK